MASTLPPVARLVFAILEPISLLAGALAPVINGPDFVASQLPSTSQNIASYTLTPTNRILSLQLGNLLGLVGMIGVGVLYGSSEPKVVRNFLIACAIADIGHLAAIYRVMGNADFLDVRNWNAMAWGSIGFTVLLFVCRVLYFAGLLGEEEAANDEKNTENYTRKIK